MRMCAEYGGMGLDATYMLAAAEEMGGAHCGGVAGGLGELPYFVSSELALAAFKLF